jgi:hypothetical protein
LRLRLGRSIVVAGLDPAIHMLRTHLSNSYRYKHPIRYRQSFRHRQRLHWAPAVDHFGAASLGPLLRGRRPRRHPFASAKQASPLMGIGLRASVPVGSSLLFIEPGAEVRPLFEGWRYFACNRSGTRVKRFTVNRFTPPEGAIRRDRKSKIDQ